MEDFDATIYLRSNEVCAANAYIQTNFRGMNILNCMRAYVYDELKKNKYKRVLTFVVDWNKAAIRMHQKWGSVEIGVAKRINLLTLAYHYSNLESNKIIFHGGPFFLWKKLFHGKKAYELKEGRDEFC